MNGKFKLKVKKLRDDAVLPMRAHHDDAGLDIYTCETHVIPPHGIAKIGTGIALEIPEGYVGLVWDKSSTGSKGILALGGVVDAGYRGEVFIFLHNLADTTYTFEAGHKVAQMLIQKVELCDVEEVGALEESKRGDKAFGSTGK